MQPGTAETGCWQLCICCERRGHDFSGGKKVLNARRGSYADSHDALSQFSLLSQQLLWCLLPPLFPFLFPDFNQLLPSSLSILHLVSYCNFTFCNLLLYCNLGVKPADRVSWNAVNSASRMPCMPRRFYDHAEKVLLLALEVRYRLPLLSQSRNLSQLGGRCK